MRGKAFTTVMTIALAMILLQGAFSYVSPLPIIKDDNRSTPQESSQYIPHAPIRINSNADFDAAHGVINWATGDGSQGNPWIIEDWDINGTGFNNCISLGNTTDYFELRNCFLYSAEFGNAAAIRLYKSINGHINNNNVSKNGIGIELTIQSSYNVIENNTAFENDWAGIYLSYSSNNTIHNNTLTSNRGGLDLFDSRNNLIINNTISSNRGYGIEVSRYSNYNNITNNHISNNGLAGSGNDGGILLIITSNNYLSDNTLIDNGITLGGWGIQYWNTHIIDDTNTVNGKPVYYWKNQSGGAIPNDAGEVLLANCTEVVVEGLNVNNVTVGIQLGFSNNNTIKNNTASYNDYVGIQLVSSSNNVLQNNSMKYNDFAGLYLYYKSNNNCCLNNNVSSNVNEGVYTIYYCNYNTFANNSVNLNLGNGFEINYYSNSTLIVNNTIQSNCLNGIIIQSQCNEYSIINNDISENNHGVYLSSSHSGKIFHNKFNNNVNQVYDRTNGTWNYTYPFGGNYWSDYDGNDLFSGPNQDIPGSDGIGDTPYIKFRGSEGNENSVLQIDNETVYGPSKGGEFELYLDHGNIINCSLYLLNDSGWIRLEEMFDYDLFHPYGEIMLFFPMGSNWIFFAYYNCSEPWTKDHYPLISPSNFIEYDILLQEGWNLVSLPLEQSSGSLYAVLASIDGQWDYVQTYDAIGSKKWISNCTYRPDYLNELKVLNHEMGFWINITEPGGTNLTVGGYDPGSTSIPLNAGWNLVGYPTMAEKIVADALWGTGADKVEAFDPAEPYRIREVGPTYLMKLGEGYWIHVPADTTWIINW